jgi:hypothetical protein
VGFYFVAAYFDPSPGFYSYYELGFYSCFAVLCMSFALGQDCGSYFFSFPDDLLGRGFCSCYGCDT